MDASVMFSASPTLIFVILQSQLLPWPVKTPLRLKLISNSSSYDDSKELCLFIPCHLPGDVFMENISIWALLNEQEDYENR